MDTRDESALRGDPGAWIARARAALRAGGAPGELRAVLAPYRICPLGAHVDHQDGPVLGMAIDAWTALVFAPAPDGAVSLRSENFPGEVRFDVGRPGAPDVSVSGEPGWGRYVRAAAWALSDVLGAAPVGIRGLVGGALPGAGLSSSASLLLAVLRALCAANGLGPSAAQLVALSRRAENEFVGLRSGILDPAAIVGAERGALLWIDPAAARWEPVAGGEGAPPHRFLVAFSGAERSLPGTGYNRRVEECAEAARGLAARAGRPGVARLGQLEDAVFEEHLPALPEVLRRRARHFYTERRRVRDGAERWRAGDLAAFGGLMFESCRSSVADYEVGSAELVALQKLLEHTPGVLGACFSGAGFGGCCVALAHAGAVEEACHSLAREFGAAFPALAPRARFFPVASSGGLELL